jgi:hypothetical protein
LPQGPAPRVADRASPRRRQASEHRSSGPPAERTAVPMRERPLAWMPRRLEPMSAPRRPWVQVPHRALTRRKSPETGIFRCLARYDWAPPCERADPDCAACAREAKVLQTQFRAQGVRIPLRRGGQVLGTPASLFEARPSWTGGRRGRRERGGGLRGPLSMLSFWKMLRMCFSTA